MFEADSFEEVFDQVKHEMFIMVYELDKEGRYPIASKTSELKEIDNA